MINKNLNKDKKNLIDKGFFIVFVLRTVVQSHRCQQKELIVGRTSQTDSQYISYPTVKVVPNEGNRLRENTFVRMRY